MIYNIEEELEKYELAKEDFSKVPADKWEHTEVLTDLNGKPYTAGIKNGVSWKLQPDEEETSVVASNTQSITDIEREKQIALKADLNLVKPDPNAPLPRIIGDTVKATTRAAATVGDNTTRLVGNVLGAPGDLGNYLAKLAGNEDYKGIVPGSEAINNKIQGALSWIDTNLMGNNPIDTWAAEPYNNETYGTITEGLMQFVIPAVPAAKLVKAGDMIVNGMVSLSPMVRGMTWGAIADTLAFPANEELITKNLAEYFAGKTPEERTEFANQIMGIFEKNPEQAEIFNQLKNTAEGLVIGGIIDGTLNSIPFIRTAVRAAKGINWKELYDRIEIDPNTLNSGGFGGIKLGDKKPPLIPSQEPFYSVVEETIENLPMEKGSGMQMFNTIKKSQGVKPEELKWSGLETFLKDKKTVTKEEMLNHMKANKLELKEVDRTNDAVMTQEDLRINMQPVDADNAYDFVTEIRDEEWGNAIDNFEDTLNNMFANKTITSAEKDFLFNSLKTHSPDDIISYNAYDKQFKTFQLKFDEYINEISYEQYNEFPLYEWADMREGVRYSDYHIIGNENRGFYATDNMGKPIELNDNTNMNSVIDDVKDHMLENDALVIDDMKPKHTDYQLGVEGLDFENPREFIIHEPNLPGKAFVNDSHYPEENPFFHYRTNDRITKDGKKTLFVEEIQSDLHQKGRGYGYQPTDDEIKFMLNNVDILRKSFETEINRYQIKQGAEKIPFADWYYKRVKELAIKSNNKAQILKSELKNSDGLQGSFLQELSAGFIYKNGERVAGISSQKAKYAMDVYDDLTLAQSKLNKDYVLDTPLKSNWHETAFRRIVRRAAEEGYDTVTWTPGSVQSSRYLRSGNDKIVKGMAAFYDGAIKNYAEKWGKKFGAKVNVTTIKRGDSDVEVWQMTITPDMRESVVTKGVPFYGIPAAIGAEQMLNQETETTQNNTI